MKKQFAKPSLIRCEIKLNENIALSWEYYFGSQTTIFHFSYLVNGSAIRDSGCYELFAENELWTTGDTPGNAYYEWFKSQSFFKEINSSNAMITWMTMLDYGDTTYNCQSDLHPETTITPTP